MYKTKEQLIEEIVSENEKIEGIAFESFCKDELRHALEIKKEAIKTLDAVTGITIDSLMEKFKQYNPRYYATNKDLYIKKIKEKN